MEVYQADTYRLSQAMSCRLGIASRVPRRGQKMSLFLRGFRAPQLCGRADRITVYATFSDSLRLNYQRRNYLEGGRQ
jgi:hypothetical protein